MTFAVIAALVLGYAAFKPSLGGGPEDDVTEKVSMRVDFVPKERSKLVSLDERVHILVTCECVLVINEFARFSPWQQTVTIPRGAQVVLNASQAVRGRLSCAIQGNKQERTDFVGTVVCTHN